jgi:hypothetical protein
VNCAVTGGATDRVDDPHGKHDHGCDGEGGGDPRDNDALPSRRLRNRGVRVVNKPPCIGDVAQALSRIFLETALDHAPHTCRHAGPLRLCTNHRRHHFADVVTLERTASGHHFVQHAAECPDVGTLVDGLSASLLGRTCTPRCRATSDAGRHHG